MITIRDSLDGQRYEVSCKHEITLKGLPALGLDVGRKDFRIEVRLRRGVLK